MANNIFELTNYTTKEYFKENLAVQTTVTTRPFVALEPDITTWLSPAMDALVVELNAYVWAEHEEEETGWTDVPTSWWQHLKQTLGMRHTTRRITTRCKRVVLHPEIRALSPYPTLKICTHDLIPPVI